MGQQTKSGFKPGSKGQLEAIMNPLKHSYDYDPLNLYGNNPDVKAQEKKVEDDKQALVREYNKSKNKKESKVITFNEDSEISDQI